MLKLTPRRVEIHVVDPDRHERRLAFEASEIRFGRTDRGNDVVLRSPRIAKKHARLVHTEEGWLVVDLKATNGVYVKGHRVRAPWPIDPGEVIWMGDHRVTFDEGPALDPAPLLLVLSVRTGNENRRYELDRDEVTLGRATDCDIVIVDDLVSRKHLWFQRGNEGWSVKTHEGIGNGTALNGVRLPGETPMPIGPGDRVSIVDIVIVVEATAPT